MIPTAVDLGDDCQLIGKKTFSEKEQIGPVKKKVVKCNQTMKNTAPCLIRALSCSNQSACLSHELKDHCLLK